MKHSSEILTDEMLEDMGHRHEWVEVTEVHEAEYYDRWMCAGCGEERVEWIGDDPGLPLGWTHTPVIEP